VCFWFLACAAWNRALQGLCNLEPGHREGLPRKGTLFLKQLS
jgi:hypothetical protein